MVVVLDTKKYAASIITGRRGADAIHVDRSVREPRVMPISPHSQRDLTSSKPNPEDADCTPTKELEAAKAVFGRLLLWLDAIALRYRRP
jgi:hypothetical protein